MKAALTTNQYWQTKGAFKTTAAFILKQVNKSSNIFHDNFQTHVKRFGKFDRRCKKV